MSFFGRISFPHPMSTLPETYPRCNSHRTHTELPCPFALILKFIWGMFGRARGALRLRTRWGGTPALYTFRCAAGQAFCCTHGVRWGEDMPSITVKDRPRGGPGAVSRSHIPSRPAARIDRPAAGKGGEPCGVSSHRPGRKPGILRVPSGHSSVPLSRNSTAHRAGIEPLSAAESAEAGRGPAPTGQPRLAHPERPQRGGRAF